MTYFTRIPNTTYKLGDKTYIVKDICKRSKFISEYKPYTDLYDEYTINDADTLESLALDVYGSAKYHWVITLFNEIHDMNAEFPLGQAALDNYLAEKYRADVDGTSVAGANLYKTKYYVDSNQTIVGEIKEYAETYEEPAAPSEIENEEFVAITFYEYENTLNEEKRKIYLLRPELLSEFVSQFERSMNG